MDWDKELKYINLSYGYIKNLLRSDNFKNNQSPIRRKNILVLEYNEILWNPYSDVLDYHTHKFEFFKEYDEGMQKFKESLQKPKNESQQTESIFDIVMIGDYLYSKNQYTYIKSIQIAKKIFEMKYDQRILFASTFPENVFIRFAMTLKSIPIVFFPLNCRRDLPFLVNDDYLYNLAERISQRIVIPKDPCYRPAVSKSLGVICDIMDYICRILAGEYEINQFGSWNYKSSKKV